VRLAAVILALALPCSASAAVSKARFHSLRAVEAAFYDAGAPFQQDWQPNRYLAPASSPRRELPATLGPHLIGEAGRVNSSTFKGGEVWVFDSESFAVAYEAYCRRTCVPAPRSGALLRADNVVFIGTASAATSKAMAQLSR
jgi:hypothetical protein